QGPVRVPAGQPAGHWQDRHVAGRAAAGTGDVREAVADETGVAEAIAAAGIAVRRGIRTPLDHAERDIGPWVGVAAAAGPGPGVDHRGDVGDRLGERRVVLRAGRYFALRHRLRAIGEVTDWVNGAGDAVGA